MTTRKNHQNVLVSCKKKPQKLEGINTYACYDGNILEHNCAYCKKKLFIGTLLILCTTPCCLCCFAPCVVSQSLSNLQFFTYKGAIEHAKVNCGGFSTLIMNNENELILQSISGMSTVIIEKKGRLFVYKHNGTAYPVIN